MELGATQLYYCSAKTIEQNVMKISIYIINGVIINFPSMEWLKMDQYWLCNE